MGVGDLGVGRQVKHMAKAFYGRIASYEKGLTVGGKRLDEAMRRNLYGTVSPGESEVATMADYARDCARSLAAQPVAALLSGTVEFAPLPDFAAAPGLPEMRR
jgi:cytochrome b pre-mRNA-processing protein 3